MISRILLLCALLPILPSCIYVQSYPDRWPQHSAATTNCPNISGVYENKGEDAGGDKIRLNVALSPTWKTVYERSITHTEITQTGDDAFKASFWSKGNLVSEKSFSRSEGDFTCESGWMTINQPAHRTLNKFILGVDWGRDRLSKNAAGDLLIRKRSSGVGLFAVIPVGGIEWLWFRFTKVDQEASANQEDAPGPKAVR